MINQGYIRSMTDLRGKVILVTGGSRRIGREIALAMAGAGANVAITYLTSALEAQKTCLALTGLGVQALALQCDVRDEESVSTAFAKLQKQMGPLDVLVNNAALYETVAFQDLTLQQWDNIFAINTRGPFLTSKKAYPMLAKQQGRIINIGSLGGLRPWVTHAHYCISKAALHSLTQVMAKALAPDIAVNCVAPGMIDLGNTEPKMMARMEERTPMLRNGEPGDVTSAVMYFASAPKFVTGQTLVVDGGLSLV